MREVRRAPRTFIDGEGNKHHLSKDAILIDLSTGKPLESLLEEAFILQEKIRKEQRI